MGPSSGDAKQTTHQMRVSMGKPCPSSLCLPPSGMLGAAGGLVSPTEACLGGMDASEGYHCHPRVFCAGIKLGK